MKNINRTLTLNYSAQLFFFTEHSSTDQHK